eukprot:13471109-Alexandrium_andersonii.AAC.1
MGFRSLRWLRPAPLLAEIPNLPTKSGTDGARSREGPEKHTEAPIFNPPIRNPRNPRNPLLLARTSP